MKFFLLTLVALNILLISYIAYEKMNKPQTGYVLIQEVFNGFELKKDYERKLTATKNSRQRILDSLETELKILGKKIEGEQGKNKDDINIFTVKRENYFQKKKIIEEDNALQTKKYDDEIITQLNQYIKDYGKEKNYTYIFGNDGNGSLMYGKEINNITKETIEYVNERYRGVK